MHARDIRAAVNRIAARQRANRVVRALRPVNDPAMGPRRWRGCISARVVRQRQQASTVTAGLQLLGARRRWAADNIDGLRRDWAPRFCGSQPLASPSVLNNPMPNQLFGRPVVFDDSMPSPVHCQYTVPLRVMWGGAISVLDGPLLPQGKAYKTAMATLRRHLSVEQQLQLTQYRYFEVASPSVPGRVYRIPDDDGSVKVLERDAQGALEPRWWICVRPADPVPWPDVMLAYKLGIEGDEQRWLATANRWAVSRDAPLPFGSLRLPCSAVVPRMVDDRPGAEREVEVRLAGDAEAPRRTDAARIATLYRTTTPLERQIAFGPALLATLRRRINNEIETAVLGQSAPASGSPDTTAQGGA